MGAGAGGWQPVDCHAHSRFSDGNLTVEEVIATARARGVTPSITDHLSTDVKGAVASVEAVEEYLAALEQHDATSLLRGGEFCWHDSLWRELPAALTTRFTHRVGSLHAIWLADGSVVHAFRRVRGAALDPQAYMDAHLDNLERFAHEMPVDVLAHPTLLPLAMRAMPLEELWTEAREERAVRALAVAGIAFEISNRYRPHARFVRRAVDRGVRISLGSDGHTSTQVADVAWPLELARSFGVANADLYDPRRHGSRTGFFDRNPA